MPDSNSYLLVNREFLGELIAYYSKFPSSPNYPNFLSIFDPKQKGEFESGK
jgi:hypothetical protein